MNKEEIRNWFESHRDIWGIRRKVEKEAGISPGYIWKMLSGNRPTHTTETLNAISKAIKKIEDQLK